MKTSAKQAKMYPRGLLFALLLAAVAFIAGRLSVPEPQLTGPSTTPSASAAASVELRIRSAGVRVLPDASIELPPLPKLDIDLRLAPSTSATQPRAEPSHPPKKGMDKTSR